MAKLSLAHGVSFRDFAAGSEAAFDVALFEKLARRRAIVASACGDQAIFDRGDTGFRPPEA